MLRKIRFGHKITLLIVAMILLTGLSITGVSAYQFRRELYRHEYSGAFTVYMAAVNYLTGHYKSKGDRFVRSSLDFVLRQKFLRLEGTAGEMITHHPSALVIYDADGNLQYEYAANGPREAPGQLPPAMLPTSYERSYDPQARMLRVAGPISQDGSVPGSVIMLFPSNIEEDVRKLYVRSYLTMLLVCLGAMAVSFVFSRRALAPIEALTRAARKVHDGDLDQQVPVSTRDEIGMLTDTFNQMVAAVVRRMSLMHRTQEWTVRISQQFDVERLYDSLTEMFEHMAGASFSRLYVQVAPERPLEMVRERSSGTPHPRTGMAQRAFDSGLAQYRGRDGAAGTRPGEPMELALPLTNGSKRLGAIHLGPRNPEICYDDGTMTTLETLAQHAAMAVDNALMYRELAEKERFQQEMKWAREIQRSLLPRSLPRITGYEIYGVSVSAQEVGGDYYDFVPTGAGRWDFVIGDVSGKGVPAALIMSIVRSLIHTYVELSDSPRDVLMRVNRSLSPDLEAEMFVTVAAMGLDPVRHRARVVRAGHEPVVVLRRSGEVLRLEPRGAALGLVDVPSFERSIEESELEIQPNDTLLMYTDGITETRSRDREEFGYDRIERLAVEHAGRPLKDMVDALIQEVARFAQGQPQHDDITVVALRRNGGS